MTFSTSSASLAGPWVDDRRTLTFVDRLLVGAGALMAIAWLASLLAFPVYKQLPAGFLPVAAGLVAAALIGRYRDAGTRLVMRGSETEFLVCGIGLAVGLRVLAAWWFPAEPANDHRMMFDMASGVAAGRGYLWPNGQPTAFFPPAISLLLALGFLTGLPTLVVAKLFGLVTGVGLVAVTFWFARRVLTPIQARWATLLTALSPTLVVYSATVGYEPLLGILVLAYLYLVNRLVFDRAGWGPVAALGLLAGLGSLVKPVCLLLPAFVPVLGLRHGRGPWSRWLAMAAGTTAIMLLVIAPWTVRNWIALGSPVLISTNGGPVLYSANNPASEGLYTPVTPLPGEVDEVSRDKLRRRAAIQWIVDHPGEWARLAVNKVVYGWGTSSSIMSYVSADRMPARAEDVVKGSINFGWAVLCGWCLMAAFATSIWASPRLMGALLFVAYLFFVHLFFEALSRHHVPVIPILAMVAAAWLAPSVASPSTSRPVRKAS
jgi:hypothetical protein